MAMPDVATICFVTLGASHLSSIIICSLTLMAYGNPRCCCHLFCDIGCKPFRFHCSLLTLIAYGNAKCCRHLFLDIGCKPFWFHCHLLTNLDGKWQCQKLLPFVLRLDAIHFGSIVVCLLSSIVYGNARSCCHLFCDIGFKSFWFHFHFLTKLDGKLQCQMLSPFVL